MVNNQRAKVDTLEIEGGYSLEGEVSVYGAKNTVSKNMVAALLTKETCTISNVSFVNDVDIIRDMIVQFGGKVEFLNNRLIQINASTLNKVSFNQIEFFSGKSRIPILMCGPMLARNGYVVIPALGGCKIGNRPIDFHIEALKSLGARIKAHDMHIEMFADRLRGAKIHLPYPSIGATEQILLASVLADGTTEISNSAIEPEILDLIAVLQKMGAIIHISDNRVITVHGVENLYGFQHRALSDRLESASWACLAAATNGKIFVRGAEQANMLTFLNAFRQSGGGFLVREDGIEFWRNGALKAMALETDVHPGFMTDWQQPFAVMLTQSDGLSVVHETVYEDRFGYVKTLNSMGARIQLYKKCLGQNNCRFANGDSLHSAVIAGPTTLIGAEISIPDLRGGFSHIIAALVAKGTSRISNIQTINRGYENIVEKLQLLGAKAYESR